MKKWHFGAPPPPPPPSHQSASSTFLGPALRIEKRREISSFEKFQKIPRKLKIENLDFDFGLDFRPSGIVENCRELSRIVENCRELSSFCFYCTIHALQYSVFFVFFYFTEAHNLLKFKLFSFSHLTPSFLVGNSKENKPFSDKKQYGISNLRLKVACGLYQFCEICWYPRKKLPTKMWSIMIQVYNEGLASKNRYTFL